MSKSELRTSSVHNEKKNYSILPAWNRFQLVSRVIHVIIVVLNFSPGQIQEYDTCSSFEHVRSKRARVLLTHSQWKVLKTP